jgi:ketosteroid isomerase-like protein
VSRENVEIVRRAIVAGLMSEPPDVQTLTEVLDADAVLTTDWGVGGTEHRGVQGTLAAVAEMNAVWDSWQQEVERVLDAGDKGVVALLRFRAKGRESAVPVESPWAMVMTLRNGRIVSSTVFLTHDGALKAVGLEQ